MSSNDTEYYRQRAITEREMALRSDRRNVATIHEELARLYEALVNEPAIRPILRVPAFTRHSASA